MNYNGKAVGRVVAAITLAGIIGAGLIIGSCFGGARFKPGDAVGLPPLPSSDTIIGFFSKFKIADDMGNTYRIKDLPIDDPLASLRTYPGKPAITFFNGPFLLYFIQTTEDSALDITTSVKMGMMQPAEEYISTGPDGVAQSGLGGDDEQIRAMNDDIQIVLPGQLCGNPPVAVAPGYNRALETVPGGDDAVGLSGMGGPADPSILCGPNGRSNTLVESLDPRTVVVGPGPNAKLETFVPRVSDDIVVNAIWWGPDATWQTSAVAGDIFAQTIFIVPQAGTALSSTPCDLAPLCDDVVVQGILAGPNGKGESGLGGDDIMGRPGTAPSLTPVTANGMLAPLNGKYYTRLGIPTNQGEPTRLAVWAGGNGVVDTPCVFGDGFRLDKNAAKLEHIPLPGGILTGVDGIAHSGIGAADVQFGLAGTPIVPRSIIILPGFGMRKPDAFPRGSQDVQLLPPGSITLSPSVPVIQAGLDGKLHTCPAGDDYVEVDPSTGLPRNVIYAGENLLVETSVEGDDMYGAMDGGDRIAFSGLGGDDYQLISAGDITTNGYSFPVVSAGPDNLLQTAIQGDEATAIYHLDWAPAGSPITVCAPGNTICAVATSGLGGDDLQASPGGTTGLASTAFVVTGGAILETIPNAGVTPGPGRADDYPCDGAGAPNPPGPNICAGPNGVAESGLWGDDIQTVRRGLATLFFFGGTSFILFPVIVAGPNGLLNTPVSPGDNLIILDYGTNNALLQGLINTFFVPYTSPPFQPVPSPFLPPGDGLVSSGLGGRGMFDVFVGCADVLDNGGVRAVDNPFINNPPPTVCKFRKGTCSDDCQTIPAGSIVPPYTPIILAGLNQTIDTNMLGDDGAYLSIADGGNGVSESGIGGDDAQVIPANRGQPDAIEVIAAPHPSTGVQRSLHTYPAGDDVIAWPSLSADLNGIGLFDKDNEATVPDPDGDERIENYATVDDGEYFAWSNTSIDNNFMPPMFGNPNTGNVVDDVQVSARGLSCGLPPIAVSAGPNGVLETVPQGDDVVDVAGLYGAPGTSILCGSNGLANTLVDRRSIASINVLPNPVNPLELMMYSSNGKYIFLSRSIDGVNWSPAIPVLPAGGTGRNMDPVVLSGPDGICETIAQGDDMQYIAPGFGLLNQIAIAAGSNQALESIPQGDDVRIDLLITTGANGIRETPLAGDDWDYMPMGKGQADAPCILAGGNGHRDTTDGVIGLAKCSTWLSNSTVRHCSSEIVGATVGDDRPPFVERRGGARYSDATRNSANFFACDPLVSVIYGGTCPWLPEQTETSIQQGGWAGFDSLGVNDPFVIAFNGIYYMYYTGTGPMIEPIPQRPNYFSVQNLGACMRAGLNHTASDPNILKNIFTNPIQKQATNSSVPVTQRIGVASSLDGVNWYKNSTPVVTIDSNCGAATDLSILGNIIGPSISVGIAPGISPFDYNSAFGPTVTISINPDGSPVFSMLYSGSADMYSSMGLDPTGKADFTGSKTGIGLARSLDGVNFSKIPENNPVFISSLADSLLGSLSAEEAFPVLEELPNSFYMFYAEDNPATKHRFIAFAKREGAVYASCLSIARTPFASTRNVGATACFFLLILAPAIFLLTRRIYKRSRKQQQ